MKLITVPKSISRDCRKNSIFLSGIKKYYYTFNLVILVSYNLSRDRGN